MLLCRSMWVNATGFATLGFMIFMPRLRAILTARNYVSPNEFMSDRFGSRTLTLLGTLCESSSTQ